MPTQNVALGSGEHIWALSTIPEPPYEGLWITSNTWGVNVEESVPALRILLAQSAKVVASYQYIVHIIM